MFATISAYCAYTNRERKARGMDLRSLAVKASDGEGPGSKLYVTNCSSTYYHYLCDGVDDKVWDIS